MASNLDVVKILLELYFNDDLHLQIVDSSKEEIIVIEEKYTDFEKMIIQHKFSKENDVFINFMDDENLSQSLTQCWAEKKDACVFMMNRNGKQVFRFKTENFNTKDHFFNKIHQAATMYLSLLSTHTKVSIPNSLVEIKPLSDPELLLQHEIKAIREKLTHMLTM